MAQLVGGALGPYQIVDTIGKGGVATVYKAHDRLRGEVVALKVLSPLLAQDNQFIHRFRREVAVLRHMSHPNIVPILEYGQAYGLAYLVMPYMASGTLLDRMQRAPMTLHEAALVTSQVALALGYAHLKGIVHRDVKPSNILLNEHGDALLSDFGLAYVHDPSVSLTGSILIGTPSYMSPEQCRGEEVDHRSDQYSYGIVLYQLTTGRLPFNAETPMAVVVKQITEPLPPPREINPQLPVRIEEVLLRALAKDPADRFRSMRDLNNAFQQALIDGNARGADTWFTRTRPRQRKPQVVARSPSTQRVTKKRSLPPAWLTAFVLLGLTLAAVASGGITLDNRRSVEAGISPKATTAANLMATLNALSTAASPPVETNSIGSDQSGAAIRASLESLQKTLIALTPAPVLSASYEPSEVPVLSTDVDRSSASQGSGSVPASATPMSAGEGDGPTPTAIEGGAGPTWTMAPTVAPSATSGVTAGPTSTQLPPTSTQQPPTSTQPPPTSTKLPPTSTQPPPTSTQPPPTSTQPPPTSTQPPPTSTHPPHTHEPTRTRAPTHTPHPPKPTENG